MADIKVHRSKPGAELPYVGSGLEARTVFADGVGGLTIDAATAKLFLYEKVSDLDGKLFAKITTNLTLSRDGFEQMVQILTDVRDQLRAADLKTA